MLRNMNTGAKGLIAYLLDGPAVVWLVEAEVPGVGTLRVCSGGRALEYDGHTYVALPVDVKMGPPHGGAFSGFAPVPTLVVPAVMLSPAGLSALDVTLTAGVVRDGRLTETCEVYHGTAPLRGH